jgi:hypothetical protein
MPRTDDESTFRIEDCRVIGATDKALRVKSDFFDSGVEWIPKSQIHDDSEVYKEGTDGTLIVTAWFAEQRGWV